jgi:hypothetical protein
VAVVFLPDLWREFGLRRDIPMEYPVASKEEGFQGLL